MKSNNKYAGIECNERFITVWTKTLAGCYYQDPLGEEYFFDLNIDLKTLGEAAVKALEKSRDLSISDEDMDKYSEIKYSNGRDVAEEWFYQKFPEWKLFDNELSDKREETWNENVLKKYKFKSKTALFKNHQVVEINDDMQRIKFVSKYHFSSEGWGNPDGKTPSIEFTIQSSSSLEVIGAAVKYAIGNCRGKGSDLIRSLLFPEGQPETFEKYIQELRIE